MVPKAIAMRLETSASTAGRGRWMTRTSSTGWSCSTRGGRTTEPRLRDFVAELQDRVAPASVLMMTGALLRMLAVLAPECDWSMLARVYSYLRRTAVPARDKLAHMVSATDLFALGISLMETWAAGPPQRINKASRYRDGLLIALLIACPLRIRNLASIEIGRHLVWDGQGHQLHFTAAETKTKRPYVASLPPELTPYIDAWLQVHRPIFQSVGLARGGADNGGNHLWLDRWSRPMSSRAIRRQIERYTEETFGKPIWPHLFRHCAVTELVDSAPDEIAIAPDLLGHADLETTQRYYVLAAGMSAHVRVQEVIAARRRAATSRDSTGTSRA
jgi:integrase